MPMPAQLSEEESVAASSHSQRFEHTNASSYKYEHTGASTLKKAHSCLSQGTTALTGLTPDNKSVVSESHASVPELNAVKADVENALPCGEAVSIWTRSTIGIVLNGFLLAFLSATCSGVIYGFFLGYMGLESYVLASIAALMKLPDVFPLPYGILTDCFPIRGQKRKPWLLISWAISAGALLTMCLKPQPGPFYCFENGEYNWYVPPCNPGILKEKNWYVFPMFILTAGLQLGSVSGQALLLEYSQLEPLERRGQIKAEMTMVCTAGSLASSLFIGIFMNSKEYLGTFDWGLSFSGLMAVCLVLVILIIPVTVMCVYEPPKSGQRTSCRAHVMSSWELVQGKALSSLLFFAFFVQLLVSMTTTAGPMVRSQWAHVKVLQQQMFGMAGLGIMMAATWVYRVYFLQASWRKAIFVAIFAVNVLDAIPQFLTTFDLVRNQYFYLGEDVVSSIPNAVLQLVSNLMIIELAEPGREGLSYGLIGTLQQSALPFATVLSNQVYELFDPKLSNLENYILDTPQFRSTVAWSYVLTYTTSFLALALLPMIPWQKAEAHRRKKEWSSNSVMAAIVLVIPALCLTYGIIVLLLTSQPETACLRWVGGQGCEDEAEVNSTPVPSVFEVLEYAGIVGFKQQSRGVAWAFVLSDVLSAQEPEFCLLENINARLQPRGQDGDADLLVLWLFLAVRTFERGLSLNGLTLVGWDNGGLTDVLDAGNCDLRFFRSDYGDAHRIIRDANGLLGLRKAECGGSDVSFSVSDHSCSATVCFAVDWTILDFRWPYGLAVCYVNAESAKLMLWTQLANSIAEAFSAESPALRAHVQLVHSNLAVRQKMAWRPIDAKSVRTVRTFMTRALLFPVLVKALGCVDESAAVAGACVETEVESLLQRPASVRDEILHIVDFREALTRVSVCDELVALKRRFVNYYREVGAHIKHSVHTDLGQTVDCIPFLKQPALLWAGEEM
ncbi:unnamed protein product, partial [Symbiodinium necroappetens]